MKIDSFANRLKQGMNQKGMKQVDLANKTNIDKSLINKYIKGVAEAGNDNLPAIAEALNVSEVWLMGYDVPVDPNTNVVVHDDESDQFIFHFGKENTSESEDLLEQYQVLFDKDNKLTDVQKEFIMSTIKEQHRKIDEELEKGNVN